jgi:hypothetical protein
MRTAEGRHVQRDVAGVRRPDPAAGNPPHEVVQTSLSIPAGKE